MADTELEIGAQSRAAAMVRDGMIPVQEILGDLNSALVAASEGFRGNAAAALGGAVQAWFDAAVTIGPALAAFADNLVATDAAAAATEAATENRFARLLGDL